MLCSVGKLKPYGAIFDAPSKKAQLLATEDEIRTPDFWNTPERTQKISQHRKRLEEALASDQRVGGAVSDLDTLFELLREGEDVSSELEREIRSFTQTLEKLETAMLLSGENDHRSAIITIHPGAGGTERRNAH
jgi:peptide chain release factor 2